MYRRNSLFNDMYRIARNLDNSSCGSCYPAVDILKGDNDFVVRAELPGIEPEKVDVELEDGKLVLRGEKNGVNGNSVYHREAYHGKFERSFTLPEGVKAEDISASYDNGVLEILIPMKGAPQPLRIPVSVDGEKN